MKKTFPMFAAFILFMASSMAFVSTVMCGEPPADAEYEDIYARWENGPPRDPNFFPIGVWLQDVMLAPQYKAAGINFYYAIQRGPRKEQLDSLRALGMYVICHQNERALENVNDKVIFAWMHGDEPDNLRRNRSTGVSAPIPPETTIADYHVVSAKDPSRPVMLNLGQGVANDDWPGRGPNATLDVYPEYCKGADMVSFDVYPVVNIRKPDGENYLWYVAKGVDRLRQWTNFEKPVWNIIECTHIHDSTKMATPSQVRSEVWMSIVHETKGLCYFVHQFRPFLDASALLHNPEMLAGVTATNRQVHELAPIINSPTVKDAAVCKSSDSNVPIDLMVKKYKGDTYIFSVCMRNTPAKGSFTIKGLGASAKAEVIGENRTVEIKNGMLDENFGPYEVHLYKISGK